MKEFTKIVPSASGPFIGLRQGLLACIKCVSKKFFLIIRMLVLPLQLFQGGLRYTLMILALKPYMLKLILFPNPNFEKF